MRNNVDIEDLKNWLEFVHDIEDLKNWPEFVHDWNAYS